MSSGHLPAIHVTCIPNYHLVDLQCHVQKLRLMLTVYQHQLTNFPIFFQEIGFTKKFIPKKWKKDDKKERK